MFVKDLMEKLSKMNPEQELIVEGFEDEVETTEEETVEEPAPEKHPQEQLIDTMVDNKLAKGGEMHAPTLDGDLNNAPVIGKYATNVDTLTKLKKCKIIAKVLAFRDGYMQGVDDYGRTIDAEDYLDQYPEMKAWWDEHKDEIAERYGYWVVDDEEPEADEESWEDEEEIDECGSACGKITEEAEKCEKCGKEPCECEKELDECGGACAKPVTEEAEESLNEEDEAEGEEALPEDEEGGLIEESAEAIEARLNEQMKTDYQKDLESISDFLF